MSKKNWKLCWALALIFMLCGTGEALPHIDTPPAEGGPTTTVAFAISGGGTYGNTSPSEVSYRYGATTGGRVFTTTLAFSWWKR